MTSRDLLGEAHLVLERLNLSLLLLEHYLVESVYSESGGSTQYDSLRSIRSFVLSRRIRNGLKFPSYLPFSIYSVSSYINTAPLSSTTTASLPPDLVLSVFKNLTSLEMVNARCACRQWLEVAEENRILWRRLVVLLEEEEVETAVVIYEPTQTMRHSKAREVVRATGMMVDSSAIDLFDQMSNSTLEEIWIQLLVDGKRFTE